MRLKILFANIFYKHRFVSGYQYLYFFSGNIKTGT